MDAGNHNAQREQIIERKMKAKYILGEMILSWSDNRARSPARAAQSRSRDIQLKASIDTSCLTTESHEMHHDLFSFTKTGEHFVLFGLDC